jgi:enamine deaminase RidA (YjgF/YER057c/UK114 family)
MQDRQVVNVDGAAGGLASTAVKAGGLVFVSAVSGTGADGKVVGPDIASQTARAIENLGPRARGRGVVARPDRERARLSQARRGL